ncbi:hypothetical protein Vafri_12669, partial [Volvox africanus]
RWRRYQAAAEQLAERRVTLRRRQLQRDEQRLKLARRQDAAAEEHVADLRIREEALAAAAASAAERESAAGRMAAMAEKKRATAVAKLSARRSLLAKLQAVASVHSAEELTAASAEQRLTARLAELSGELDARRDELARAEELVKKLQQQQQNQHHHHHQQQEGQEGQAQTLEELQEQHADDKEEKQLHRDSAGETDGTAPRPSLTRTGTSAPTRAAATAGRQAAAIDKQLLSEEQRQVALQAEVRQAEQALDAVRERTTRERDAVVRQLQERLRDATLELAAVAAPVGGVVKGRDEEELAAAQRALAEAQVRVQMLDEQLEELRDADDIYVAHHGGQKIDISTGASGAMQGSTGGSNGSGGRWRGFDAAIRDLMAAPPLAGRLLGRLCDVLRVRRDLQVSTALRMNPSVDRDLDLEVPVNTALSELCHLPTCLVVTDRGAAEEVRVKGA